MFTPHSRNYHQRNMWVSVGNLCIGMWVSGLDRPWLETPFPLQGFMVRSYRDIESLKLYCDKVEIDVYKCWVKPAGYEGDDHAQAKQSRSRKRGGIFQRVQDTDPTGDEDVAFENEVRAAKRIYSESAASMTTIMDDIRHGKAFDCTQVKAIALEMVGSILRNSDALIWLSQLRNKDDYAYQHSINVCILMLSLGKHLALGREALTQLGFAGLVQDIGVLQLPAGLLGKQDKLSAEELTLARSHVEKSLALLHNQPGMSQTVLDTVGQHHERYDGSGYPQGLRANEITLSGNISGIADCFDAMVSDRPYARPMSSFQALMHLYGAKGRIFNPGLVERFIQAIGIYPIGSVVEMMSGEVGIVVEQRRERRLKPKLLIVLDAEKKTLENAYLLDLLGDPSDAFGRSHGIKDVLESGAFGIDPTEYYLV